MKNKKIFSGMLFFAGLFIMIFGVPILIKSTILAYLFFIGGFFMILFGLFIALRGII